MIDDWLQQIINEDEFGLLYTKPIVRPLTEEERTVIGFEEINKFFEEHNAEPKDNPDDIIEKRLFMRLKAIRDIPELASKLKEVDVHKLLPEHVVQTAPSTIEEIMASDDFGMLKTDPEHDIFTIKHGRSVSKSVGTFDHVAKQKKCLDFDKFEPLFKSCQEDLKNNKRRLMKFSNEGSIKPGTFFILRGMLLYIDSLGKTSFRNHRMQARTRCIYENGTESDILKNSLAKTMYTEGQIVSENIENTLKNMAGIDEQDAETGYIYILKSLSKDIKIKEIPNLYKIGWSSTKVEDRIKNAINEPTYLMSKVKIVETYKIYNVNAQKFEDLIHNFFKSAQVLIDVIDNNGTRCSPKEWFSVPLGIIQQAIELFISGDIVKYKYDREHQSIVEI